MKTNLSLFAVGFLTSPLVSALTNGEASEIVSSKYGAKTNGSCVNAANPNKIPEKIQKNNLFDNDDDGVRVCYEYCLPFEKVLGYVGMMVQKASSTASCACFFDEGTIKPERDPFDNTNVKSVGPVKGFGSNTNDACYPFKGYEGAHREDMYDGKGLFLKLDGAVVEVPNEQITYKSYVEDNRPIQDYLIDIHSTKATMKGNMWRALELPDPLSIYELGDFVVSFDFSIEEAGQIHGICFEENLIYGDTDKPDLGSDSKRCLTTAYFKSLGDVPDIIPTQYQTRVGGKHRYVLNLKKIFKGLQGDEVGASFVLILKSVRLILRLIDLHLHRMPSHKSRASRELRALRTNSATRRDAAPRTSLRACRFAARRRISV